MIIREWSRQKSITFLTGNYDAYDTNSGALRISGGLSTKGNAVIGNNLNVFGNVVFNKLVNITDTTDANDNYSGSLLVDGGASIKKNVYISGKLELNNILKVNDVTDSSDVNTASVILSGGCAVSKQLRTGGNIVTSGNLIVSNDGYFGMKIIVMEYLIWITLIKMITLVHIVLVGNM